MIPIAGAPRGPRFPCLEPLRGFDQLVAETVVEVKDDVVIPSRS